MLPPSERRHLGARERRRVTMEGGREGQCKQPRSPLGSRPLIGGRVAHGHKKLVPMGVPV